MPPTPPQDLSSLSYEQARDALIQVVNQLEAGGVTLEDSLQLWERGEQLAARCEAWLAGARERLEAARNAATTAQPFVEHSASAGDARMANDTASEARA